jgi:hypothetical protein
VVGGLLEAASQNDLRLLKEIVAAALGSRPVRTRPRKRKARG